jgi:hypothetical protein
VKQRAAFVLLILLMALRGMPPAVAETDEERLACVNDALQFCQDAIPDRERVYGCLVSHKDVISVACHTVIAPAQPADRPLSKKQTQRVKVAKSKGTSAKHASKTVSGTSAKHASKIVSGKSAKHASKAGSRPNQRPLNLLSPRARAGSKRAGAP